jgi:hypothetical protein
MKHFSTLLAALSCLLGIAFSQDSARPIRTCRVLFLSAPDKAPAKPYLFDGKSSSEITLPTKNFSEVYPLAAGNITLSLVPRPFAEKEVPPAGTPSVKIPENINDCYLLIAHDPESGNLRIQMVNANAEMFKAGQMLWYNLTPHVVGGTLGERTINIKPQSRQIVDAPAKGFESYKVKLGYMPAGTKRAEPLSSTLWRHNPEARSVVLVFMRPDTTVPRIASFYDERIAPSKPDERVTGPVGPPALNECQVSNFCPHRKSHPSPNHENPAIASRHDLRVVCRSKQRKGSFPDLPARLSLGSGNPARKSPAP